MTTRDEYVSSFQAKHRAADCNADEHTATRWTAIDGFINFDLRSIEAAGNLMTRRNGRVR